MKQSQLFTKTGRQTPKDEQSINAQLLIRAGFIDKLMAGVYTLLPLGLKTIKKIENIIREEINQLGGQEIFMPSLQPKENWLKTGRWDTMNDLYKVKDASDREFALGPTHEEVVVPLAQKYINSYKDFPFSIYQFQNKFRMELRSKSGILRGREFIMKDLYSFHLTEEDFDSYYAKAAKAYEKIFQRTGIGDKTFKTFSSGGSFSKYSHEYQTITPAGEDTIHICNKCELAINEEIKGEIAICPVCEGNDFRQEKSIEVGNIFSLKNKYTQPFDFKVKDEHGEDKEVIMGCYGIGLGRLMGTIVEVLADDKGIIWPKSVAPFACHLLPILSGKQEQDKEILEKASSVYDDLQKKGIAVLYDDRNKKSAGEKFADADLIGIPLRIVVSQKTIEKGGIELKERGSEKVEIVSEIEGLTPVK